MSDWKLPKPINNRKLTFDSEEVTNNEESMPSAHFFTLFICGSITPGSVSLNDTNTSLSLYQIYTRPSFAWWLKLVLNICLAPILAGFNSGCAGQICLCCEDFIGVMISHLKVEKSFNRFCLNKLFIFSGFALFIRKVFFKNNIQFADWCSVANDNNTSMAQFKAPLLSHPTLR